MVRAGHSYPALATYRCQISPNSPGRASAFAASLIAAHQASTSPSGMDPDGLPTVSCGSEGGRRSRPQLDAKAALDNEPLGVERHRLVKELALAVELDIAQPWGWLWRDKA